MPCDGVAVAMFERDTRNNALDEIKTLIAGMKTTGLDNINLALAGDIAFMVGIPTAGGILPVKIGISRAGKVTMITQGGTFDGGKKALEDVILKALKERAVGLRFETHRHAGVAPRLSYNIPSMR